MTINTKEAEIEFEKELSSINWNNETYDINATPDDAYNDLTLHINKLKDKHFPKVTKRFNKYRRICMLLSKFTYNMVLSIIDIE